MKESIFTSAEELNSAFSVRIAGLLQEALENKGSASLLVSGGRTPLPLFKSLSETDLDWANVTISLADERWVANDDEASNEKLVRENLLQGKAASANFIPLKTAHVDAADAVSALTDAFSAVAQPFDVVILGMGEDGHTASLFPCSEQIEEGLETDATFLAVQPTTAPHQRMSFSFNALKTSKALFLHLTGDKKKTVLDDALAGDDLLAMPIRAFLQQTDIELFWAP